MCELLISNNKTSVHPDPVVDREGMPKRGDLVAKLPDGHEWGSGERLPNFVILKLPGVKDAVIDFHIRPWYRRINYFIVGSDPVIDGFRIRIETTEYNSNSGEGKITRDMVELYLNKWGASVVSIGDNQVTFDVRILDAIKSQGFWSGVPLNLLGISEINYEQSTGVHTVRVDYSGLLPYLNDENRERAIKFVVGRFSNIFTESLGVFVGDTDRAVVRQEFQDFIKRRAEGIVVYRKFYLSSAVMDVIEANGGIYTATKAQYLNYIRNKMTE